MRSKDAQSQDRWTREEVVLLVAEYFRTKNMIQPEIQESQTRISTILRNRKKKLYGDNISSTFRNLNGIALQYERIKCIDPETKYEGMKGTKLQVKIVQEYLENPSKIKGEAYEIVQKYGFL